MIKFFFFISPIITDTTCGPTLYYFNPNFIKEHLYFLQESQNYAT